jgi:sulfite reductase (NADPH) flavoprotein alpha-component
VEGDWAAGDVVEIERVVEGRAHHREYSIASLPADGRIELVVREHRRADGSVGFMSGWLTGGARLNAKVQLRVRTNNNFHAAPGDRPRVLIGAGTGIAGLRGHIKAGGGPCWLIFGERSRAGDYLLGDQIDAGAGEGRIARLDLAFSRDGGGYVQDRLRARAADLRAWIDDGAAVFVCGSLAGMGQGVHEALAEILGPDRLRRLTEDGLYRRDLY